MVRWRLLPNKYELELSAPIAPPAAAGWGIQEHIATELATCEYHQSFRTEPHR